MEPLDMLSLRAALRAGRVLTPEQALRVELHERVNALGIGAQGLGGLSTVLDVKLRTYPTHAAAKPVALIPNCAANRHARFTLDGHGPARFDAPPPAAWPDLAPAATDGRRVDLDTLTRDDIAQWRAGDTLLLNGRMLTGRDAAHRRIQDLLARGEPMPADFAGRVIYYVGPVDPVRNEAVGPAGPPRPRAWTATRR